ncbi:MAG: CcdB family protein [Alphaproteobacteria bacterium]|nr:CcdB family protein [Alphaproteobacteria bacterium]
MAQLVSAAQFDVFPNPDGNDSSRPFVLVVQFDHLQHLRTRVVMPLMPSPRVPLPARLAPRLDVAGQSLMLSGAEIATVDIALLKSRVANLSGDRDRIMAATDVLLFGI